MTPERWQEIKRLFEVALACEPVERPAFLAEACHGDAGLQQELESLLAAHDRAENFGDALLPRGSEIGSRLGPYEILSALGAGGMGEVYKARDTRLDRVVAIKVLSPFVAGAQEIQRRFEREARAVARLNHPNICTLYDVGSDQGVSFLVMEYLEGQTLAEHLRRTALSPDQVLRYAIQVTEALDAAHRQGIIHRDLKPGNVMLTERGAILLDFGLAKLRAQHEAPAESASHVVDAVPLTGVGRALGTLHYMAPEQLKGEDTDARTDIFALGTVLYEMATRRKAFEGSNDAVVIDAILHDDPPPISSLQPLAPASFDGVVTRCLGKSPDDRWQSCQDLLVELRFTADRDLKRATPQVLSRRWAAFARFISASARRSSRRRVLSLQLSLTMVVLLLLAASLVYVEWPRGRLLESIAVLPFVNATADPEFDYLSEGLTDGLINSLSRIRTLRVAPRTLVLRYATERADVQAIARLLNVQAVVTGRITRRGDSVTVAAELVDVRTLSHLWGEQYRSSPREVLGVEKAITTEIVGRLQRGADQRDAKALARQYSDSPEAYEAYLRGRYYLKRRTHEGYTRSIEYFEQALAKDPSYALAYAGLADAFTTAGYFGEVPTDRAYPKAKIAALRALQLDDQLAESHTALAAVMLMYEWNFPSAEQLYERAIELDPTSALVHSGYSMYLASQGRLGEAISEAMRAEQLDPVAPSVVIQAGWMFYFGRQYDRAIEQFHKTLELNPNFPVAYALLAQAVLAKGLGGRELRQILGRYPILPTNAQEQLAYVDAVSGDGRAKWAFLAWLGRPVEERQMPPITMAYICAALGQRSQALDWLEKAYAMREGQLVWLNVSPNFDSLRTDPRFADLVRRVGLPH